MSARRVSIVVPARNEESVIGTTLAALREPEVAEIIVVDGESSDRTVEVARHAADLILRSSPGRARQMNAGAEQARGDVLMFLHADTLAPAGFARAIVAALDTPAVVGGRFDIELDAPGAAYRWISLGINLRSRWSRISTGDQGLFVRREIFQKMGGFPEQPLLEDLAFSTALRREGEIACLRERLRTSARRWQKHGAVRTVVSMWTIRFLYRAGVSADRLARYYLDAR